MPLKRVGMLGGGVIAVLGLTLPATAAAAPPPGNAISGVSAVCQADGMFQVTVNFSHRGAVEVRVYDVIGGALTDSDHAWYYRKGSATFQGLLWGGGGDKVTIETHLLTNGPHHTLVDVVTPNIDQCGQLRSRLLKRTQDPRANTCHTRVMHLALRRSGVDATGPANEGVTISVPHRPY